MASSIGIYVKKITYTIGNDGYRQLSGPGSSYYTSKCWSCGAYASSTYEWQKAKLCFECYEMEVLRNAKNHPRNVEPEGVWSWEGFWFLVATGVSAVFVVLLITYGIVRLISG
jgi:hypothetical protein